MTGSYAYTTPEQVAAEIRATEQFSDTTIPTRAQVLVWIKAQSAEINRIAARVFGSTQYIEEFDYDGSEVLTPTHSPIITVDSFQYNANPVGSSSGTNYLTKTEDVDFTVYKDTGEIALLFNNFTPSEGRKRIKLTYTAGFETIPENVSMLCTKLVAADVLNSLIGQNVNEGNDGGSISVGSISIVEPASYGVNSYKQLKTDIEKLTAQIVGGFGVHRYGNG